jgi:hypothetical protein
MVTSENNNGNNTLLIAVITAIIVVILLTSCSAKKVNKSEVQEREQKTEKSTLETQTIVNDNTKIVDLSESNKIEIEPVDNSKPIIVNGKTYLNVKIKQSKKKNNITTQKDVKIQHNVKKEGLKTVKTNKQVFQKQVEKKSLFSWWWLLLLLIPIYYLYRKYFCWF